MSLIFQKVLKGIPDLEYDQAEKIVKEGIMCNWWRQAGTITPAEIKLHLNSTNVNLHLNKYHEPVPMGNPLSKYGTKSFGEISPFISTTAGAIQRNPKDNILFPPWLTATNFATHNGRINGYVFYAYVMTIGVKAIEFEQFAEEVRELHIYRDYLYYHKQGEVMAKILIPSVQIERAEFYEGKNVYNDLRSMKKPAPSHTIYNSTYQKPEKLANIREVLL